MKKKELEKIVDFLCRYNKDDIVATHYGFYGTKITFKYLYDGKLMETKGVWGLCWSIVSNNEYKAIIKVDNSIFFNKISYYELNKENARLIDITEYYKPNKENNNG